MVCDSERLVKTCCKVVVWFTGCLEITAEYPGCEESWRILEWDENKSYIGNLRDIVLPMPSNARYCRFSLNLSPSSDQWASIQFEEGNNSTAYEPYHLVISKALTMIDPLVSFLFFPEHQFLYQNQFEDVY